MKNLNVLAGLTVALGNLRWALQPNNPYATYNAIAAAACFIVALTTGIHNHGRSIDD